MNTRELATVLAALRLYQSHATVPTNIHMIASDGDQLDPLSDEEIDVLCQSLNTPRPWLAVYTDVRGLPQTIRCDTEVQAEQELRGRLSHTHPTGLVAEQVSTITLIVKQTP